MRLKTDTSYDADNFVQRGSYLDELTVTITLCEYRDLVQQSACDEKEIESLQEEIERLRERIRRLEKTERRDALDGVEIPG